MEECPKCGKFEFAEFLDHRGIKRCLSCGYKEKVVYKDKESRLERLIKLHEKELQQLEEKERLQV